MPNHESPTSVARSILDDPVLPMIERGMAAFRRELPELLPSHYRQWVAYHGDARIGFARTQTELVQECLKRGLSRDEFVVCGVAPPIDDELEATPNI